MITPCLNTRIPMFMMRIINISMAKAIRRASRISIPILIVRCDIPTRTFRIHITTTDTADAVLGTRPGLLRIVVGELDDPARQALLVAVELTNFDFRIGPAVQGIDAGQRDVLTKYW